MADHGAVAVADSGRVRTRHRIDAALIDAIPAVGVVAPGHGVAGADVRIRTRAAPMCG